VITESVCCAARAIAAPLAGVADASDDATKRTPVAAANAKANALMFPSRRNVLALVPNLVSGCNHFPRPGVYMKSCDEKTTNMADGWARGSLRAIIEPRVQLDFRVASRVVQFQKLATVTLANANAPAVFIRIAPLNSPDDCPTR
jgi:hypothetical protein